ncbi:uncharacterized protein LOC107475276 [Arachis duranensis]|uniref:Uncharacterized protein LOC107475276 n=1 Tax=Arachis duranensis TaxID=130453 RepID=A0A6P5N3S6_ARADU|nr:uncharacterized protein LOC107475276 [Arachis duranensis]
MQDVVQILDCHMRKDDNVVLIGLWGMGGVGTTTFAKTVYNKYCHMFECPKFLPNIREMWKNNQQVFLQEQLLNGKDLQGIKIKNIESGVAILKRRLCTKKALVVLDDVNNIDQLNALCGSREWFGAGSRIIITTRDRRLLCMVGVDHVHRVTEMDYNESLELLCWNAFTQATPLEEFARLAKDVVAYCGGLPLALVTIGCQLFGKTIEEWETVLDGLKRFPHPDVHKVLKMSYDDLNDDTQKEIFLDIASFCIGMESGEVLKTLNYGFGLGKVAGIGFLEEQSLITFDDKNRVRMHPLLRDMGREIVREQSQTQAQGRMYDVFLSFRGKDTRSTFTSHLHASLQNASITVFKDDDELQRGERISISLLKAIGLSACSVIVISTHYADSRYCLQELENIMVCHRTKGQVVFPIFYEVDPSDVRYQKKQSKFGKAFEDFISRRSVEEDKVQSWRADLREVSNFSGITVINSRNESEDIKRIVEHISRLLDKTELFIAAHPVGVLSRMQKVIEKLHNQQRKDVLILGIKGMGGIGKTTIAKAIFNKLGRNFEGRSFLLNIRETWQQDNGKVSLQERLLHDVFRSTTRKIHNIDSGKQTLMESLRTKRVLIVLDDVDNLDQLNALCGSRDRFGPGSTILVTTRDDHLLRLCGVNHTFDIEKMNTDESLELFSWHAFKQAYPKDEFFKLSRDVVEYSNGLPLALEVLGSYLFDREIKEWQSALDRLKSIPNNRVQKILQISFDGLSDDNEKEIFLDIACFFIGMDRNDVVKILNGCGFHAEIGIRVLIERNLVTVDNNNMLGMHELLQEMGRAIICEKSPELEERSRIWYNETLLQILENHEGTNLKAVKGLSLKLPTTNSICLSTEAFKTMSRLKLLQLASVQLNGEFKHVSRYLRWMSWHGLPLTYTPKDCYQPNIISIELENSKLKVFWKEAQLLRQLKILNLSHSHDLRTTPDFSYLPNLEKLVLKDCTNLSSIFPTIGSLEKILLIDLEGCTNLLLPRSIYKLKSLETLIISGCSKIDKLEEDVEQMESLAVLKADNTGIIQVPNALSKLRNMVYVAVGGYEGMARDVIPLVMFWSWTSPTNMLSAIMEKCSSGSSSTVFMDVTLLTNSPRMAKCDPRLHIVGDLSSDTDNNVAKCNDLLSMDISESISSNFLLIQMGLDNSLTQIIQKTISQNNELGDYLIPYDNNNPGLLAFSGEGSLVKFQVPQTNEPNLKSMMLRIIFCSSTCITTTEGLVVENVRIINQTKNTSNLYEGDKLASFKDEDRLTLMSNLEPGDTVQVIAALGSGFIVKKTIVYLIYGEEPPTEKNSQYWNEVDIVPSIGDVVVADVNGNALGVGIIATDDDEDVTVFGVHEAVAGMSEIVSGVDAMAEYKDDVTVASVDDDTIANLNRHASSSITDSIPPSTNGLGANYVAATDMNASSSSVDDMLLADDNNDDDVAAIGDQNVNNNLNVAALVKRQPVEAISTTMSFDSKSEGLIPLVQIPFGSNTYSELTLTKETVERTPETICISHSATDLCVNPASPVTTIIPMMVAEEDELDEDSDLLIAELDKTLSDSYILYSTSGSPEVPSLSIISIFQKMQLLLDNEPQALVGDVNIKNQLLGSLAQLGQIMESSQIPKDLHSLITEIRHFYEPFLNDFPSAQEVLDNHQRLIDSKNGLQEKLEAAKARQGHFSSSISKGKERVHEMSKEINELEVQLKALHEKRNRLQFTVERCEVESVNINRKLETLVKENEEVVSSLKESESAFRKAELSKQSYERKLAVLKQALYGNTRH